MKKKILISLLVIVLLLSFTGCGKTKKEETKKEEEVVLAEDEVVINKKMYKLNVLENGYGINYKIASNFRKSDTGNALNYYAEKNADNTSDFVIRVFHYKNKSIDYAIKDTVEKYDSKTEVEINGLKYTKVHFVNYNNANTYLFYYKYKKDVYAFCFTAWKEEERLENIFLTQIVYEKTK